MAVPICPSSRSWPLISFIPQKYMAFVGLTTPKILVLSCKELGNGTSVYVCGCGHICVHRRTYVDVHMEGGDSPGYHLLLIFFFFSFWNRIFPWPGIHHIASLAGQQAPGIWVSLPSQCWGYKCATTSTQPFPHPKTSYV